MTPTEAIASIRASIAAGLSPSLSDIEVLIAECGRVDALERKAARHDWFMDRNNQQWVFGGGQAVTFFFGPQMADVYDLAGCVDAALTTQAPRNENG